MIVIQSEQGKELLKDFATKKQAKQYWNINEKGKYSKNVNIVFKKSETESEGGKVETKINNQTYDEIKAIGLKKGIDKNVKLNISIESSLLGIVEGNKNPNAIVETYAHETFIHASFDIEFIRNILSDMISNPNEG